MESIQQKSFLACDLASDLVYEDGIPVDVDKKFGAETADLIWDHADGLIIRRIKRHVDGRCSIAASLRFDLHEEELRLDEAISKFRALKAEVQ